MQDLEALLRSHEEAVRCWVDSASHRMDLPVDATVDEMVQRLLSFSEELIIWKLEKLGVDVIAKIND